MDKKLVLKCEFFKEFTFQEAEKILSKLKSVSLHKGDTLFSQGDESTSLFILVSGKLSVFIHTDNENPQVVGEIFNGETVGEMGLLNQEKRSAGVKALRKSELLELSLDQFNSLWQQQPSILLTIAKRTTVRLRQTLESMSTLNKKRRILLVPENTETPLDTFVKKMKPKIKNSQHVHIVTYDDLKKEIGELDDFDQVANFLDNQDQNVQTVIYIANIGHKKWMDICLELSDKIMVVADGSKAPRYNIEIEQLIKASSNLNLMKKELILLHPNTKQFPTNTKVWLEKNWYDQHHHICLDDDKQMARMYRFLLGIPISFVFAGGGAKSFAQIGALKALEEAGIPIDAAGGTSQGSVTAWLASSGKSYDSITETVQGILKKTRKGLNEYTIPLYAVLSGKTIVEALKFGTEETKIEDLWHPMFCISVDIEHRKEIVHRDGLAWRAIRASISLPAIFPPLINNKGTHVDGGVMNNCPVDVMKNDILNHDGYVIAFDFTESKKDKAYSAPENISMVKYFLNKFKLTHYHIKLPGIGETLMRSLMTSSDKKSNENIKLASTCIRLPTNEFSLLDYSDKAVDKLLTIGYETTKKQLAEDPVLQELLGMLNEDDTLKKAA